MKKFALFMKKFALLMLSVPLLLLSPSAFAGRYWATVAVTGRGTGPTLAACMRPAYGTSLHPSASALVFVGKTHKTALVLVVIPDDQLPELQRIAVKVHGREVVGKDRASRIPPTLRKKLVAEAKRLGAAPDWYPEEADVVGE